MATTVVVLGGVSMGGAGGTRPWALYAATGIVHGGGPASASASAPPSMGRAASASASVPASKSTAASEHVAAGLGPKQTTVFGDPQINDPSLHGPHRIPG